MIVRPFFRPFRLSRNLPPLALSLLLACTLAMPSALGQVDYNSTGNLDEYARYTEQASQLFSAGQLTQAIELFERALAVAPEPSIPVVYNNLAVTYIKRGNYFHDKLRQDENALNDFRKAYFYLDTAWPEGLERKPLHETNRKVAKENLLIAYRNLGINPSDRAKHLEMARQSRMRGKFPEAIVEYAAALELDKNDAETAKALGDLFNVVNLPEKSKKYYSVAVKGVDEAGLPEDEVLVQLGNAQYKTGEVDKAIVNFDKALDVNPANVSALNMLEKIWLNEIKFNPSSVLGHANLGSVYQKKKQYEQAFQQYNAAEHFAEQDPKTLFDTKKLIRLNLGTLFQAQKRYELALKAYDTVLQVDPNHVQALFYKATLLEDTGNTDGAIQAYNKVLSLDPQHKAAQVHMLVMVKQQADPVKLARGLREYADRFPQSAAIQAQIGEEFHQRKDLENAGYFYQRAIQLNPNLASAWANLGAVYQAQGKLAESAEAYRKAQALSPDNQTFEDLARNAVNSLGYQAYQEAVRLQQEGRGQEALSHYRQALASTDTPEIRAAYAVCLQSLGQLDDAIAEYRKVLAKEPDNADYQYYLGTAFHQKADLAKAQEAYKKALSLNPGYTEAREALAGIEQQQASAELEKAVAAYNQRDYSTALTLANQALTKKPQEAMAHYYKGLILDGQKKYSAAAQSYRDAIRYNAEFADAYYALGVALDNVKDPQGAKTAFQRFIELSGSNEDDFVKYARERVSSASR